MTSKHHLQELLTNKQQELAGVTRQIDLMIDNRVSGASITSSPEVLASFRDLIHQEQRLKELVADIQRLIADLRLAGPIS